MTPLNHLNSIFWFDCFAIFYGLGINVNHRRWLLWFLRIRGACMVTFIVASTIVVMHRVRAFPLVVMVVLGFVNLFRVFNIIYMLLRSKKIALLLNSFCRRMNPYQKNSLRKTSIVVTCFSILLAIAQKTRVIVEEYLGVSIYATPAGFNLVHLLVELLDFVVNIDPFYFSVGVYAIVATAAYLSFVNRLERMNKILSQTVTNEVNEVIFLIVKQVDRIKDLNESVNNLMGPFLLFQFLALFITIPSVICLLRLTPLFTPEFVKVLLIFCIIVLCDTYRSGINKQKKFMLDLLSEKVRDMGDTVTSYHLNLLTHQLQDVNMIDFSIFNIFSLTSSNLACFAGALISITVLLVQLSEAPVQAVVHPACPVCNITGH